MYRGELNPNGVAARCGGRTKPRGCCGHHSQRDFDCAVPTLGLDDAIPGVEDRCKMRPSPGAAALISRQGSSKFCCADAASLAATEDQRVPTHDGVEVAVSLSEKVP